MYELVKFVIIFRLEIKKIDSFMIRTLELYWNLEFWSLHFLVESLKFNVVFHKYSKIEHVSYQIVFFSLVLLFCWAPAGDLI